MPDQRLSRQQKATRQQIVDLLGGVCQRCGFTDLRALQIDHVEGNGNQHIRGKSVIMYYREVLASVQAGETRFQLLCANCNWIKRAENSEC